MDSDTQITAVAPAHAAGNVDVSVTTPGGTAIRPEAFTFIPEPAILSVAPPSGPDSGGDTVVITGTGFTGATAVTFDLPAATSFTVDTDTQITAVTPPHAAGPVDVRVTTPGGTAIASGAYTYVAPPTITSIVPPSGPKD